MNFNGQNHHHHHHHHHHHDSHETQLKKMSENVIIAKIFYGNSAEKGYNNVILDVFYVLKALCQTMS